MPKKPSPGSYKVKSVLIDTKPTTYNTRFRPNALNQVADTINSRGLPLLLVHDSNSLPVGAWYSAEVNQEEQVVSKFYIPSEISEYEDIKTRIDTGILDSVSIGFSSDVRDCSICGNDIYDYDACPHIPGKSYEITNPTTGEALVEQTCYVMLDGIHAKEASLVYSGAVPQAKIVDASDKAEFFTKNDLNFAEGNLEVVHSGEFLQDSFEQENYGSTPMDEKFAELNNKYNDLREENIVLKTEALEHKTKLDSYADLESQVTAANDKVVAVEADLQTATEKFAADIESLRTAVASLAAPFDATYEAPQDMPTLLKDLDTYLDKAKSLPSGRQSQDTDEPELAYSMPVSAYQV
jgi:hypothetical protein